MLKQSQPSNYISHLEANELLTGKTDVLVCDGFTGNVAKRWRVVRMFLSLLKSGAREKTVVVVAAVIKTLVTKKPDEAIQSPQPRPV